MNEERRMGGAGVTCLHGIGAFWGCQECGIGPLTVGDIRASSAAIPTAADDMMTDATSYSRLTPHATPLPYPLPRMVRVEWRRGRAADRVQHAVGFLVSETATHLVLSDQFDGKHPNSRRLWTIDVGDVESWEEVRSG